MEKFFTENFLGLAGFWGDMTVLDGVPRGKFADIAKNHGYEFIDNGDTFVLAQYKFC